ncbi:MAG: tetratricopeptide repeat protein [Nannocystaceae bacterium]
MAERQGDTVGARQFHERAISVARAGLGEDHPTMAELTNNLAVLDYSLGDIARAKAGFTRTLALVRAGGSAGATAPSHGCWATSRCARPSRAIRPRRCRCSTRHSRCSSRRSGPITPTSR